MHIVIQLLVLAVIYICVYFYTVYSLKKKKECISIYTLSFNMMLRIKIG